MIGSASNSRRAGDERPVAAIILAAGRGTRMKGEPPKVVYEVAGRPMVRWVVEAARGAGCHPIVLVIGHGGEQLRAVFAGDDEDILYAPQDRQLGTGHATACARSILGDAEGDVVVLAADGPLIRPSTITRLISEHRRRGAAATLATATVEDPSGYGRVLRKGDGRFQAILEEANATSDERAIKEIYPSYACFDVALLFEALGRLAPDPTKKEYLITDVPGMLREEGHGVELVDGMPPEDVLSINTPEQLAEVDAILSTRAKETA